jgi:teichuronic acid biosynthesis glycosyltransferase TuaC
VSARRILTFTSLYPSAAKPRHGIFVETRLRQLAAVADVDCRVIAPVPWFPLESDVFGDYAQWARTPATETRHGIPIWHPRYAMVPKVGMRIQPAAIARAADRLLERFERGGWRPDLIDAHYFYPDGVAAAQLAARFDVPLVITARGTDINLISRLEGPRRDILRAAERAAAVVAVSEPLRDRCIEIGMDPDKVVVLRNGVDLDVFRPLDRRVARAALRLADDGPLLLAVGNLVPEKRFELALAALALLPQARLLIVGEGRERDALLRMATRLNLRERVEVRRPLPQHELATVYSAADVLLLPSQREGWPNVVLEALACGTPVVAADVGAVRQILAVPGIGAIADPREAAQWTAALQGCLASADRTACRAHAARFGWQPVARDLAQLFDRITARPGAVREAA